MKSKSSRFLPLLLGGILGILLAILTDLAYGKETKPVSKKNIMDLPRNVVWFTDVVKPGVDMDIYTAIAKNDASRGTLHLYINSPGGSIIIGQNILSALASVPNLVCYIQSAHSMAFVIMTYCDKVVVTRHSYAIQHSMQYMYRLADVVTPQIYQWYERQASLMGISYQQLERQYYSGRNYAWTGPDLIKAGIAHEIVDGFRCKVFPFSLCKIGLPYDSIIDRVEKEKKHKRERTRRR